MKSCLEDNRRSEHEFEAKDKVLYCVYHIQVNIVELPSASCSTAHQLKVNCTLYKVEYISRVYF